MHNKRRCKYLTKRWNPQNKTNRIKNIAFAGSIQASDGIEILVEASDNSFGGVALKAIDLQFNNVHFKEININYYVIMLYYLLSFELLLLFWISHHDKI